jgi:hypothetical protein
MYFGQWSPSGPVREKGVTRREPVTPFKVVDQRSEQVSVDGYTLGNAPHHLHQVCLEIPLAGPSVGARFGCSLGLWPIRKGVLAHTHGQVCVAFVVRVDHLAVDVSFVFQLPPVWLLVNVTEALR